MWMDTIISKNICLGPVIQLFMMVVNHAITDMLHVLEMGHRKVQHPHSKAGGIYTMKRARKEIHVPPTQLEQIYAAQIMHVY